MDNLCTLILQASGNSKSERLMKLLNHYGFLLSDKEPNPVLVDSESGTYIYFIEGPRENQDLLRDDPEAKNYKISRSLLIATV